MVNNTFRDALREIRGDSWLDELSRASLAAAQAKFTDEASRDSYLRVTFEGLRTIDAHDSHILTKAIQDATAKLGRIIRQPKSEAVAAHAADRAKATLIQRGQAGNFIVFGFSKGEKDADQTDSARLPGTETPPIDE